jgi:hypothetical protein
MVSGMSIRYTARSMVPATSGATIVIATAAERTTATDLRFMIFLLYHGA